MKGLFCILVNNVLFSAYFALANKRVSRVINGELVEGRHTGYNVVRYFAAIGTLHGESALLLAIKMKTGKLTCGGALITPGIAQTACHCLSYTQQPSNQNKLLPAKVKRTWESTLRVYIGVNKEFGGEWSMANVAPLIAKKFVVHQECAKLPKSSVGITTFDYGWIILDPNWDPNVKYDGRVNYAPLYTEEELEKILHYLDKHRAVCLVVGFGPSEEGVRPDNKEMRHGWLVMVSRWKCLWKTGYGLGKIGRALDLMTWICLVPFRKHHQMTAHGDSGSPVTCSNQYFALVLGSTSLEKIQDDFEIKEAVNFDSALYWAKFQNAMEYRRDFIRYMEDYGKIVEDAGLRRIYHKINSSQMMLHQALLIHQIASSLSSQITLSLALQFLLIRNSIKYVVI